MSYAATTFQDIITHSFDGRKSSITERSGLSSPSITRLSKGSQAFTPQTLQAICHALPPDDARRLCLAACRDLIPPEYASDISLSSRSLNVQDTADSYGIRVDAESERILSILRSMVATEPETRDWLHRLGSWISPTEAPDPGPADLSPATKSAAKRAAARSRDKTRKDSPRKETP